ncbi:GMC family oxidoreductase N-terminal domain-containing protein [Tsukamurella tyrosinosolvens]|uniref:GMC family oxidoreductase n=1 Tax=Tsukamurella tyrosinosolvens TaxID=57704 RepID=UPI0007940B7B|nr:GMC family oxidoreductase N-terminal domain-containing protein [Tsukamurella tyrosinosolvens]KXP05353.1 choline dehydrogenase [Tsukamurella tyrosinosolvens]KZL94755.1 choline dehydrogenase [Tsukamurella tyrosinosolvens]MCA4994099.1 GMC family oxidoreductase N-terminal domain-containing protein [Tsukamurella tyrosinosolvens]
MPTGESDYIVIGAGSAGSVVARRLVDAGHSVHVIEAGAVDADPNIHSPQGWPALLQGPNDWAVMTTEQEHAAGRSLFWPRGKVLGGSSSLNGMIYIRGHRDDYDAWEAAGNEGWGWGSVLELFKRSEDHEDGASTWHGAGGPLHVSVLRDRHPAAQAFVDAAVAVGHKPTEDFNGDLMEGVGFNHTTIKDGRRHSAWQAFAVPVLDSPRLTVTTGALVTRIVLDGGRAVAVEYLVDGELRTARASAEIVLSAGAIGSPKILQLSGIGDRADLSAVGVETLVDLPGVGKNLHDHLLVGNLYATADALVPGRNNLLEAQLFAHSQQTDDAAPDLQPLFLHLPYPTDGGDAPADGYTIAPGLVAPRSRGTLRIASADPAAAPLVDPNILADDYDVEALVDAVILCREIGAQDAFAAFRPTEYVPSSEPADRDALRALVRRLAGTYHHQVGTCAMGVTDDSVVDPALRVRGVAGLRVADASIMPVVPRGNTNAPAIMVGEKATDLLLGL